MLHHTSIRHHLLSSKLKTATRKKVAAEIFKIFQKYCYGRRNCTAVTISDIPGSFMFFYTYHQIIFDTTRKVAREVGKIGPWPLRKIP